MAMGEGPQIMKFPISIPRSAFKVAVVIVAALCGGTVGGIFTLALRGMPIPTEMSQFLLAISGILAALIMGPKTKEGADEESK